MARQVPIDYPIYTPVDFAEDPTDIESVSFPLGVRLADAPIPLKVTVLSHSVVPDVPDNDAGHAGHKEHEHTLDALLVNIDNETVSQDSKKVAKSDKPHHTPFNLRAPGPGLYTIVIVNDQLGQGQYRIRNAGGTYDPYELVQLGITL